MPRTTLALDEDLLRRLKEKAAREGRTMQDVANELLRMGLTRPRIPSRSKLQLRGWKARLQAGVDLFDRNSLFDVMDGR
ncbi:MAG TPA: ribbon-helix-helix protein, CopG family [Thermoanaerobaculia bacterium]|nr:ribbon-helix-helix protein, CopG family [Thermoanaerobaculia bacterium]